MKKNCFLAIMLMLTLTGFAQNKCNGYVLKLRDGTIEKYDSYGSNLQSKILSNVSDFDCNENEIAVVTRDGNVIFYDFNGNTKFSCNGGAKKIRYLDDRTYVVTKEDGTMRKYEINSCNDRGSF